MTFDIHELDRIEFGSDGYEDILHCYVDDVVDYFASSTVGQAYCQEHEEYGRWIYHFVDMAYVCEGFTLSKMNKGNVEIIMEDTLPRKITLGDRSEAMSAVPELIAFWQFLKAEHNQLNAGAIITYLKKIEDKFPDWMVDPARGGMAKQFLMGGMQSGFDMSTEEGLAAYQQAYNQKILGGPSVPSFLKGLVNRFMPSAPEPLPINDSVPESKKSSKKKKKTKPKTKGFGSSESQSKSKRNKR